MPFSEDQKAHLRMLAPKAFQECCARREELKAAGAKAGNARKLAYEETLARYAPGEHPLPTKQMDVSILPSAETPAQTSARLKPPAKVKLSVWKDRPKIGILREVEWVAGALVTEGVKPKDSPSAAAWSLFVFASRSPAGLLEYWRLFAKTMPARSELAPEDEPLRDHGGEVELPDFLREPRSQRRD